MIFSLQKSMLTTIVNSGSYSSYFLWVTKSRKLQFVTIYFSWIVSSYKIVASGLYLLEVQGNDGDAREI